MFRVFDGRVLGKRAGEYLRSFVLYIFFANNIALLGKNIRGDRAAGGICEQTFCLIHCDDTKHRTSYNVFASTARLN